MAANEKSTPLIKISNADLIEAGILTENPRVQEVKAGPAAKQNKVTFIKINENYLKELQNDTERVEGFPRPSMSSARRSGVNSLYNIKKTTTTISRRSSNVKKEITRKSASNFGKVLKAGHDIKDSLKLIPIPPGLVESLEKEVTKTHVRKQLFKMPESKPTSTKRLTLRAGTSGKYFQSPSSNSKPKISSRSPLLDIDKVESILKKKSSVPSVGTPRFLSSVITPSRLSIVQEENSLSPSTSGNTSKSMADKQRSSTSSNTEFETLEQMCDDKYVNEEINKVLGLIKADQEEFETYKDAHNQKMSEITRILIEVIKWSKSVKISENNKENSIKRRSKPKTPNSTLSNTHLNSNKPFDLRKNVLTMSLGNTPKEKKAERMYNSLRATYGILETPKFDKKTPKSDTTTKSGAKNISARIQEQCLMLMDTPQSKK